MRPRMTYILSLFFLLTLTSCSLLQDVDYARLQANNGFADKAEKTLKELGDDGYVEAQLALADLYSKSDDPALLAKAGVYYRRAREFSKKADYNYVRWLEKMSRIDAAYMEPARRALLQRQETFHDALPLLARFYTFHRTDYPDADIAPLLDAMLRNGINGKEEVTGILNTIDDPQRYSALINRLCGADNVQIPTPVCLQLHFKLAKAANDSDKIDLLSRQLQENYHLTASAGKTNSLSPETEELLYRCAFILLNNTSGPRHVAAGLHLAALGSAKSPRLFLLLARQEYRQRMLLSDEELVAGLVQLVGQGNAEAKRILGRMYATGQRVIDDPVKAEQLLVQIPDDPRASLYLGRLYLTGKLGVEKLQAGVNHLLFAARRGESKAYYELAKAFNGWPGIRSNTTYSWVFATMAEMAPQAPQTKRNVDALLNILQEKLNDRAAAEKKLGYERARFLEIRSGNRRDDQPSAGGSDL